MKIIRRRGWEVPESQVTPERFFLSRRALIAGGVGALTGSQEVIAEFQRELAARRDLFYKRIQQAAHGVLTGEPPTGALYAFMRIDPGWRSPLPDASPSPSWAITEFLIKRGRIGCVPGVDFGRKGEGYIRFCFARSRDELRGALESMGHLFKTTGAGAAS